MKDSYKKRKKKELKDKERTGEKLKERRQKNEEERSSYGDRKTWSLRERVTKP